MPQHPHHPDIIPITTLDDPRLADYRDIKDRQLTSDFHRPGHLASPNENPGKFMAEGEVVLRVLLRSSHRILSILTTPTRLDSIREELTLLPRGVPVFIIDQARIEHLVGFNLHRGLMAIAARNPPADPAAIISRAAHRRPLLLLEDLTNHDNIGSIFRSVAAFGAAGILLSPRCADPLYRKALRVSVGCALVVPWAFSPDWPVTLEQVKAAGVQLLGFTLTSTSITLEDAAVSARASAQPTAFVFGTEGPGLSLATSRQCDQRVLIPMASGVDSLNVGVTAAIALYRMTHGLF